MAELHWADEIWRLDYRRAVYWERTNTLLIADPHFGKDSTFRSHGLAVPAGSTRADLQRLDQLVDLHRPRRLIVLGDFLHGRTSRQPALCEPFSEWRRRRFELEIVNVPGNHDRHAGPPPCEWNIQLRPQPWLVEQVLLRHEPVENPPVPTMAGHLHPALRLAGAGGGLKLACFWISGSQFVLPAYGSFIAMAPISPRAGDQVYVCCEDEVLLAPSGRSRR